ncbi:type II toxin-antitoxin system Phd/YefM family antitoxin [Georgenia yuyongxinii]
MAEIGIRALKQNASAVVARAASGETLTITDRGRPVARLTPLARSPLEALVEAGEARPPRRSIRELPIPAPGTPLSPVLTEMRDEERY